MQYRKNGYSTELEQVVHTHGTSIIPCLMGWPRGLNLNRHSWIFTSSQLSPILASTYSFTSAAFRKPVHTARRSGRNLSYPISKSTRAEISIPMCEQNPYQVWFSFLRKRHPVQCEPFSSPEPVVCWSQQIKPSGTGDENECEYNLAPEEALFVAFFRGARASSRRGAIHARIALSLFAWKPPQK